MSLKQPNRIVIVLLILCCLVALGDLTYEKHPHVHYEAWFNFFGFAALAASVLLVVACSIARPFLSRREDYYDG